MIEQDRKDRDGAAGPAGRAPDGEFDGGEPEDLPEDLPGARPEHGYRNGTAWLFAWAFAGHRLLVWALEAVPGTFGEPLLLRWLRALTEHPLRGPLGLGLVLLACGELARAFGLAARRT